MSLYTDIVAGIVTWTNRPLATAEMDIAIRQALRAAHRAGKFPRDLVELSVTGLSTTTTPQVIDLSAVAPRCRQIALVTPTSSAAVRYREVLIGDLFDQDGFYKTDVFYQLGTNLCVRPGNPTDSITISYYQHPITSPLVSIDSWLATSHQDLVVCLAAASVLAMEGEQEIKTKVERIAAEGLRDLIAEQLQLAGS